MPRLALSSVPPERAAADLLVLPVAAGDTGPVAPPATAAVLERLGANLGAVAAGRFTGALDNVLVLPGFGAVAAGAVLLVGVGPDAGRTTETLRRAAAVAVGAAGKAATLAVALHQAGADGSAADGAAALAAVAEGTVLAAYRFQRHKSAPDPDLAAATLLVDGDRSLAAAEPVLRRAEVAARATLAARDLVNEPASRINPATLAAEAVRLARAAGLDAARAELPAWDHPALAAAQAATAASLDAAERRARDLPAATHGLDFEHRNERVADVLDELLPVQAAEEAVRALRRGRAYPARAGGRQTRQGR